MPWEVIDISRYNTSLTYNELVKNINGVIIRIGYRSYGASGTLVTDTTFNQHYNGLANETKIGFYWFSSATSEKEAIEEANYCHTLLAGKQCDFPVYFESKFSSIFQSGRADKLSKESRTKYCIAWCDRMVDLGYRAGIYAADSWFSTNLELEELYNKGYSILVTNYDGLPSVVAKYDAWEYTNSGSVPGCLNAAKISHFYNNVADWPDTPTPPGEKPEIAKPTLIPGDNGVQVTYLQQDLNYTIGANIDVDGFFNAKTEFALNSFKIRYKLSPNGIYDINTYKEMALLIDGRRIVDINTLDIKIDPASTTYTGSAITPRVIITGLIENIDYITSYSNNINVGTGTVTIEGINNFVGTVKKSFTINKQSISSKDVNISQTIYEYTGYPIKPSVSITGLTINKDYTVSYIDNINMGTGAAICTGIGNYTDTTRGLFFIIGKDISKMIITLDSDTWTYTGSAIKPKVTVKGVSSSNYKVTYSNNINVGTGDVIVTGTGDYFGTATLHFTITKVPITNKTIVLSPVSYIYDGTPKKPTVSINGVRNTNYDVVYSNNINAGIATVIVTGKNNYEGQLSKSFTINPKPITNFTMPTINDQYYTGGYVEPSIKINGLIENVDYTVTYGNNIGPGEAYVNINGIGNYTDMASIYFNIIVTSISKTTAKYGSPSIYTIYRINNAPLTLTFNGRTLEENTDYVIKRTSVESRADFMLYTFIVEGMGGFTNEETYRFRVVESEPSDIDFTDDGVYNYGDIDEGDETAVGNYDFYDIDPKENHYNNEDSLNSIRRNGSVLLSTTPDDIPEEDDPSVVIDEYDYDFERFSHIYIDRYDEDDGTNIDENGEYKKSKNGDEPDDGSYNFGCLDIAETETAVGDYDFGDLDEGTSKDSVADGDYDFNIKAEGFIPGADFILDNTPIYANFSSNVSTKNKSGIYFIYKPEIINNKIRITKLENGVGEPARNTGWVNIDDLSNLGKYKVGDPIIVSGRVMKYTNGDNNEYSIINNSLMYIVQISNEENAFPYGVAYGPTLNRIGWVNTDCMDRYVESVEKE